MGALAVRRRRSSSSRILRVGRFVRLDLDRWNRTGTPEVILAEGKRPDHLVALLQKLSRRGDGAWVSRLTPVHVRALLLERTSGLPISIFDGARYARLEGRFPKAATRGIVAILSAGTSDVPVATEAEELLETLGVRVKSFHDVGIAGLHRLHRALRALQRARPVAYLVFAGREGALPTLVAGLVRAPVIGIPTSVGYGRGGKGEAALASMLQSCAPLAVVNIDAAIPAALLALQIARVDG